MPANNNQRAEIESERDELFIIWLTEKMVHELSWELVGAAAAAYSVFLCLCVLSQTVFAVFAVSLFLSYFACFCFVCFASFFFLFVEHIISNIPLQVSSKIYKETKCTLCFLECWNCSLSQSLPLLLLTVVVVFVTVVYTVHHRPSQFLAWNWIRHTNPMQRNITC